MPLLRPLAALGAASLLALAGCSDGPFAPIGPLARAHFALSHVNGAPLPATLWESDGARLELVGETLAFHPFGRVERSRVVRYVAAGGDAQTSTLRNLTHYRVREEPTEVGSRGLVIRVGGLVDCPTSLPSTLSVACDPEEQAVVDGDELRLTSIAVGVMSATPLALRFQRYDPADHVEVDARRR